MRARQPASPLPISPGPILVAGLVSIGLLILSLLSGCSGRLGDLFLEQERTAGPGTGTNEPTGSNPLSAESGEAGRADSTDGYPAVAHSATALGPGDTGYPPPTKVVGARKIRRATQAMPQTAPPSVSPSRRPRLTHTPVASRTRSPRPGSSKPALVMDVADARATALTWSIPRQAPRIERAGYMTVDDLVDVLGRPGESLDDIYLFGGSGWRLDEAYPEGARKTGNDRAIALELSQLGMDLLLPAGRIQTTEPRPCSPVPRSQRYAVTVFWNPHTGLYLGQAFGSVDGIGPRVTPHLDHERVTRTPWPTSRASATATPTPGHTPTSPPTPTPPPVFRGPEPPKQLGVGEYPIGVYDMVHAWPLVKGSRWIYRVVSVWDAVAWQESRYTETVSQARMLGPNVMEVELSSSDGSGWIGTPWSAGHRGNRLLILPDRVVSYHFDGTDPLTSVEQAHSVLDGSTTSDAPAKLWSLVALPLDNVSETGDAEGVDWNYWTRLERHQPVDTPAGSFESCAVISEIFNAGNSWYHWLCPGMGAARHELPGCSSMSGGYTVMELIEWYVPLMRGVSW